MSEILDPKLYGLPPRTVLKKITGRHIAIVINRKSRIIMSDGKKILEKAEKIKKKQKSMKVSLETSAPVCSKTVKFLSDNKIEVILVDLIYSD